MSGLPSLFVTGTDTGVGKTVVTAMLLNAYRERGISVAVFKPVAAGASLRDGEKTWADISFLAASARMEEEQAGLYRLGKPLSPHLAAEAEDVTIDIDAIKKRFCWLLDKYGAVLVEGAGGVMAPIGNGICMLDMAAALRLPVVIVTHAGLGTLNHTLLTVSACRDRGLQVAGLVINRVPAEPDETEQYNLYELGRLTGIPVLGVLPEMEVCVEMLDAGDLARQVWRFDLSLLETIDLGEDAHGHESAIEADRDHVWHPFSPMLEYLGEKPHPLMIVAGEGNQLVDSDGRRYIDGTASLWVNVHGHRRAELDQAVRAQLGRVAHSTLLGLANEPSALLARELVSIAPEGLSRVFFSDNGSTAVEVALKVAFQYWRQSGSARKKEFITFVNDYHGDTLGAVSVGGLDLFHSTFKPLLFQAHLVPAAYCYRCPVEMTYPGCDFGCLKEFEAVLVERAEEVAAVIVEPLMQGAAGILVQPPGYLKRIASLCKDHGVLLIADEVATGFGRCGALFACQHEDVTPDIMAVAKGLTGGYLPLAATLFREEIYEAFLGDFEEYRTFFHGHTYTGNPLACAAAQANIELLNRDGFLDGVREKGELLDSLLEPLRGMRHVGDVRRLGLMAGIELVADRKSGDPFPVGERVARRVTLKARQQGIIIRPLGDTVVLAPPLSITVEELERLGDATAWAIEEVTERGNG